MPTKFDLVKRDASSASLSVKDFPSRGDKLIQENIRNLQKCKKDLDGINSLVQKALDLPVNRKRRLMGKILNKILPTALYRWMPSTVVKFAAEEQDVLEFLERLLRENVDNVQGALRGIAVCAAEKRQAMDELEMDLDTAQKEQWDARTLQQYIAGKAGVEIYDEVAHLLDREFHVLPDEDKERRKDELLIQLRSNIAVGETLMDTLRKVCVAGIQVFHKGVEQYFNYVNFYKPIAAIRDSAKTMVDMNTSMFAARDALVATFKASVVAIEVALDAAKMTQAYSIVSDEVKEVLEAGQKRLEARCEAIQAMQATNQKALLVAPSVVVDVPKIESAVVVK